GALGQVENDAAFVAAGQKPGVVKIGARISRNRGEGTPQITVGRALDFDHVGAEIRQDGGRRRSGYIGGAVDNFESGKYTLVRIHKTPAPKRRSACPLIRSLREGCSVHRSAETGFFRLPSARAAPRELTIHCRATRGNDAYGDRRC